MGNTGLVILLLSISFFVVVGLSATGNLLDEAKTSNDSSILNAASGAGQTMGPLWTVFAICILITAVYALIHAFHTM